MRQLYLLRLVTLIVVWHGQDQILVAADMGAAGPGIVVPRSKVWQINDLPLVWGYTGPEIYGELLRSPMESARSENWDDMRICARANFADRGQAVGVSSSF